MQTTGDLKLNISKQGGASVLRLAGAIGMAEASALGVQLEKLVQQPQSLVVVDMSELDFLCSSGLGALINAHAKARPFEGEVRLAGPGPMILRLLETTRLTNLFAVYPDVEEALKGCAFEG